MTQTIFSADLTDFCQKFLVIRPGAPEPAAGRYVSAMEQVRGGLFQNLLLFDKPSLKITGESIPIPVLIGAFGQKGFDELLNKMRLSL